MKVKVLCTLTVEVELPDDTESPHFVIEENGCPGTGIVGRAIDDAIKHGEENSVCWACNLRGENIILAVVK